MKNLRATLAAGLVSLLAVAAPVLAQVRPDARDSAAPSLNPDNASYTYAWLIAAIFTLGIIAIAFKSSKRSHLD